MYYRRDVLFTSAERNVNVSHNCIRSFFRVPPRKQYSSFRFAKNPPFKLQHFTRISLLNCHYQSRTVINSIRGGMYHHLELPGGQTSAPSIWGSRSSEAVRRISSRYWVQFVFCCVMYCCTVNRHFFLRLSYAQVDTVFGLLQYEETTQATPPTTTLVFI